MAMDPEMDVQAMEKLAKFFNVLGSKQFAAGMQQTADGIEEVNRTVGLQDILNFNKLLVFLKPVLGPVGLFLANVNANTVESVSKFALTIMEGANSPGGTKLIGEIADLIDAWLNRLATAVGYIKTLATWFHELVEFLKGLTEEDLQKFIDSVMSFINAALEKAYQVLQDAFNRNNTGGSGNKTYTSLFGWLFSQFSQNYGGK